MTISELVSKLESIKKEHGDLRVMEYEADYQRFFEPNNADVSYMVRDTFRKWGNYLSKEEKGEKVCEIWKAKQF